MAASSTVRTMDTAALRALAARCADRCAAGLDRLPPGDELRAELEGLTAPEQARVSYFVAGAQHERERGRGEIDKALVECGLRMAEANSSIASMNKWRTRALDAERKLKAHRGGEIAIAAATIVAGLWVIWGPR